MGNSLPFRKHTPNLTTEYHTSKYTADGVSHEVLWQ